ncbi:MAG: cysteine desulfurase family protein [Clostridia bacterium]
MEKIIYVDHSATTPVKKEVLDEMLPYFNFNFGNASSSYSIGRVSKAAIEKSRSQVAQAINCKKNEVYFTSGGSEADNMIIRGIAKANIKKGNHIITTKIEHMAVLNTCKMLEKEGFEVTYLNVDANGKIHIDELEAAIKPTTILISIMYANNEIGTIQPIEQIGNIAKAHSIYFHSDAVQAVGNLHIDVNKSNIDALSISAHKFYGPKGVGVAYIKEEIKFIPLINGGHQEKSMRAGTENVAGIIGLGKAIEIATKNIDNYSEKLTKLRDLFIYKTKMICPGIKVNGDLKNRLPGNINISIPNIDSLNVLLLFDMNGICASSGSACNTGVDSPSHVLSAIGLSDIYSKCSIRISLGQENTLEEIEYILNILSNVIKKTNCMNKY